MSPLRGADIAAFLGRPLLREDLPISGPADLAACGPGDLVWARGATPERLALLEERRPALVLCDEATAAATTVPAILCQRPRLDFIRVLRAYFAPAPQTGIHPTAIIDPRAQIGAGVSIGAYARIGPDVVIGEGSRIGSGVSMEEGRIELGRRCVIKANSTLGGQGFGFEYDEDGSPLHFPHVGRIVLEDEVWLGSCTTVERATLGVTRLCRGAKVDDLVQIGHNTYVGEGTLIMAGVVLCGGCRIGAGCWLAPKSVIKEKVVVGDRVTVGLSSVVLRDVPDGAVIAGVPARPLARKT